MINTINQHLTEHLQVIENSVKNNEKNIKKATELCINALENGNKILLCGNGGSAADSQHIAAELVGSFNDKSRRGLPAIAITTDSSALTSISNDLGYENIFSRQIEALANTGDVLIGISTSGNSANIVNALKTAKNINCVNIGFSGGVGEKAGGVMNDLCEVNLIANSNNTARVQEFHILLGHIICDAIDKNFMD
jgi:D-sedoheptulose 7-phosphate isomerase